MKGMTRLEQLEERVSKLRVLNHRLFALLRNRASLSTDYFETECLMELNYTLAKRLDQVIKELQDIQTTLNAISSPPHTSAEDKTKLERGHQHLPPSPPQD